MTPPRRPGASDGDPRPGVADPRAADHQVTVAGATRVTVLTERLVRLEHAADGAFEDRPTLAVVNRRFPPVPHAVRRDGRSLTVDTGAVEVRVADVDRPFGPRTLRARIRHGERTATWTHGAIPRRNLGGTVRTLDGWWGRTTARVTGFAPETGFERVWEEQDLGPGLLSRDGWAVVDDSAGVVLDARGPAGRPWPVPRPPGDRHDLYLFAHGDDHRAALADGAALLGPQPLPPRWAFGYWYSRYYPYTDVEVRELADRLDQLGIPADVLVIDMDWHRVGWTGYSWDRTLFPDPDATLADLRARGLRVALNLHPADGVGAHEDAYAAVAEAMGVDPATAERVPFDVTDPRFVDAYFRLLHHPEEDRGVDLWWMDWQQGTDTSIEGLDPLAWLNHLHWHDQLERRPDRRPLIFSRYGGLGAGRHPIGFSGDTWAVWDSLAFQPEVTATAANVLYGYWSHDVGGHFGVDPEPDGELYARWLQLGAHSPVLRTHGTLGLREERRVWEYPNPYRDVMVEAIRHRYEMVPYLYGECRRGVGTGLSLVRPMYHEHPDLDAAYRAPGQFHLGADLVVAPVVAPRGDDGTAEVRAWLPPGTWHDTALGRLVTVDDERGRWVTGRYLLDEVPTFARGGAVVPGQRGAVRLDAACYPNLVLTAHPGGDGHLDLYEDDGTSQGYLDGRSATTPVAQRTGARRRSVVIGPAGGSYRGWRRRRDVEVRLAGEAPPASVRVDGEPLPWAAGPTPGHWWYDAARATVAVSLPQLDLGATTTVAAHRRAPARRGEEEALLDGLPGLLRRLRWIADDTRTLVGDDSRRTVALARTAERVDADPATAADELRALRGALGDLDRVLARHAASHRELEALNPDQPALASARLDAARRLLATTRRLLRPT